MYNGRDILSDNRGILLIIIFLVAICLSIPWILYHNMDNNDDQGQSNNVIDNDDNPNKPFSPEEPLASIPTANRTLVYAGDGISFSSNLSTGNITEYQWLFGDGSSSSLKNPTHSFLSPGWYNVSLLIISSKYDSINSSISIGVQRRSIDSVNEIDFEYDLGRKTGSGFLHSVPLGPNIGNPQGHVKISIGKALGSIEIIIKLRMNETYFPQFLKC